ncbi:MAG: response regulator [Planctomycetes bacterium]|nr:response regulator [Planctomycetota bacterium]
MATQTPALTLLLVDDDPSMVRLLSKVIERSFSDKINVESLTDPVEARERISEGGIDILVTDLEMPSVNGLELLRCAKRRNACTQVLFLTGHSTLDSLLDAFEFGATDYLLKPVDQDQLLELVEQAHVRQRRWQRALADTWQQRSEATTAADG